MLVNNAGYGYRAAVEEGDDADVRQLFDTNFFGAVALIKAVLPGMRARRDGAIVNISSIGARICPPGSGYYAAVKSALEGMSGSLRKEVGPLGITVMVVEPGGFRTDFAGRSLAAVAPRPSPTTPTPPGSGARRTTPARHPAGRPGQGGSGDHHRGRGRRPARAAGARAGRGGSLGRVLDAQRAELDAWAPTSLSTDFPA